MCVSVQAWAHVYVFLYEEGGGGGGGMQCLMTNLCILISCDLMSVVYEHEMYASRTLLRTAICLSVCLSPPPPPPSPPPSLSLSQ